MTEINEQERPEERPTLENYLARVPLNQDMRDLAREVAQDEEPAIERVEEMPDPLDPLRELDDGDRKELAKLVAMPGWEVLTRIRKRACAQAEKAATLVSQENPLANAQKIAEGWAMFTVMRQVMKMEQAAIDFELQQLKQAKRKRQTQ